MLRLVDEIIQNSSYIESKSVDYIEYVALSSDAYLKIVQEIRDETGEQKVTQEDIDDALTIKTIVLPRLIGIDYKFFKELTP